MVLFTGSGIDWKFSPQSARVSACSACWVGVGAGVGVGVGAGAAGRSPGGERPGLLSSRESRPEGRKHQGRAGHQTEGYQILLSCCQ